MIPYFFLKLGKMLQNVLSAAVVIGALRVNGLQIYISEIVICCTLRKHYGANVNIGANSVDPHQTAPIGAV